MIAATTTTAAMWMWMWMCGALLMAFTIRQARRSATKLRLLLAGPSGSGKTWGALVLAKGLGGRTIVIDTEEGSSDLYDHLLDFSVIDLRPPYTPERYIDALKAAEAAGAEIIVIDSVTHCWSGDGGCLDLLEDIAKAQFRGNTWSAFSVITPRWRRFVDAVIHSPAHIICTGRSKTETAQSTDAGGRKRVEKLGMKLEARDGLEYEFTVCLDLIHDGHFATTSKDRTGLFAGDPKPLTEATGRRIAEWLAGAQERPAPPPAPPAAPRWLDRVNAASTGEELDELWQAALDDAALTDKQRSRLSSEVAKRRAAVEVALAKGGVE